MTGYVQVDWARVLALLNDVRRKRWEQRRAAEAEREERNEAPVERQAEASEEQSDVHRS